MLKKFPSTLDCVEDWLRRLSAAWDLIFQKEAIAPSWRIVGRRRSTGGSERDAKYERNVIGTKYQSQGSSFGWQSPRRRAPQWGLYMAL